MSDPPYGGSRIRGRFRWVGMRTPLRRTAALGALALVASLVALAAPTASQPALGDCTPGSDWPGARSDLANAVLAAVNAHRATVGAPALAVSSTLSVAAVWKARHMAMYGYMAHDDPAPPIARTAADRLAACGYSAGGGENIAYGYPSADAVMQGWLSSPGHRANIEQSAFLATGIGAAVAPNGAVYWAETFGTSTAGTPPPPPPPPPPPTTTTTTTTTPPTTTTTPKTPPPTTTTTKTPPHPPAARPAAPRLHLAVGPSPDRRGPRADRRFVLRFPLSPSAHARRGVTCRAHVGRVLASGFGGGYARCVRVAPRGTKGRRVWGIVEVRVGGVKVRRWFSRLVR